MSIIDRLPMRITGALCPECDKGVAVENGDDGARFVFHKGRNRKTCPMSGRLIPPIPMRQP